jgi:hypothetical protein
MGLQKQVNEVVVLNFRGEEAYSYTMKMTGDMFLHKVG